MFDKKNSGFMFKKFIFIFFSLFVFISSFPQNPSTDPAVPGRSSDHDHHDHEYTDHGHHHTWEIGFGAGWVRLLTEKENAPGFHLHVLRSIGKSQKFSIGPGLEFIADDHKHMAAVFSLGYRPVHPLYFGVSPGISFPLGHDAEHSEPSFSSHFEVLYEFEFDFIHLGPMIEYSWGAEDQHLMLALHIGFNF